MNISAKILYYQSYTIMTSHVTLIRVALLELIKNHITFSLTIFQVAAKMLLIAKKTAHTKESMSQIIRPID